jgi:protein SCO1/2
MRKLLLFILFVSTLNQVMSQAENDLEIGIVEKLDQFVPLDAMIVNESGDTMTLGDIMDKPTILSFVYYRCPGICSPLMDGLADVIDATDLLLGTDFQVLTISFDAREGTVLAVNKKNNYLNLMKKKEEAKKGWMFFTSDSANIKALTESTGFRYKPTGNDFIHAASIIILSPEGKITRYMNGIYFLPFELKMSLVDAADGKSAPTINRVLLFCYSYDPAGQNYVFNVTKVSGVIIIFLGLTLFAVLVLRRKRKITV